MSLYAEVVSLPEPVTTIEVLQGTNIPPPGSTPLPFNIGPYARFQSLQVLGTRGISLEISSDGVTFHEVWRYTM
jgi:hypothetical protein